MLYGVIGLISAQLVILLLTGLAYMRLRQHGDMAGRDVLQWAVKIEAANTKADSAMVKADKLVTEQYDALAAKYAALHTDYLALQRQMDDMSKRYEALRLTIASNARQGRRERAKEEEETGAPVAGEDPLEFLKRNGQAIPLAVPGGKPSRPVSTFGRSP